MAAADPLCRCHRTVGVCVALAALAAAAAAGTSAAPAGQNDGRPGTSRPADHERTAALCDSCGQALPTVLLLGVKKAATTSMHSDLLQVLDGVLVGPKAKEGEPLWMSKELHFFDVGSRWRKGDAFYGSYFPSCEEAHKRGLVPLDGTPNYFGTESWHGNLSWVRAKEFYAREAGANASRSLVFVIVVREPAERYVSAFHFFCEGNSTGAAGGRYCKSLTSSVDLAVDDPRCQFNPGAFSLRDHDLLSPHGAALRDVLKCPADYLRVGMYWLPLLGWISAFPGAQFVVTTFSHYKSDPDSVLSEVGRAVGVANVSRVGQHASRLNVGSGGQNATSRRADSSNDESAAKEKLGAFYEKHSTFFWFLLRYLLHRGEHRLTFVGKLGEF